MMEASGVTVARQTWERETRRENRRVAAAMIDAIIAEFKSKRTSDLGYRRKIGQSSPSNEWSWRQAAQPASEQPDRFFQEKDPSHCRLIPRESAFRGAAAGRLTG